MKNFKNKKLILSDADNRNIFLNLNHIKLNDMLHFSSVDASTFRMYGDILTAVPDLLPKTYVARATNISGNDVEPRITIVENDNGKRLCSLRECTEIEINGATFTTAEAVVSAFNAMTKGGSGGGTLSLLTYRIPQVEVTGAEDTFVIPAELNETGILYAINGKFTETLLDGITSVTNGTGDCTIVFDDPIPLDNVVVVFYEPA